MSTTAGVSLRAARRALEAVLSDAAAFPDASPALEVHTPPVDPPRLKACHPIEGTRLEVHEVGEPAEPAFVAFLDGVQESRVLRYVGAIPIVHGHIGAVIRVRVDRRMTTWSPGARQESRLYAPRALLGPVVWKQLERTGLPLADTMPADASNTPEHPFELLRRAVHAVQEHREHLERDLADAWCEQSDALLYVDGALTGSRSAAATCCVGVVKSHHTLYADGADVGTVLRLEPATRTSVIVVERAWGPSVASWYLRLHDASRHDPMWGLVRIEVALVPDLTSSESAKRRADQVSRWILAERTPLSLPDGRWDTMVYGVHDCEVYLRALSAGA